MRSPRTVWDGCAQDERWCDESGAGQVELVEQILREGFTAGFAAGAAIATESIDEHAALLARQLAVRVPESVPRGLRAAVQVVRELGLDRVVIERAWRDAVAVGGPAPMRAVSSSSTSNEGAKPDMAAGGPR